MKKLILLASLAFSINAFAQVPTNGLVGYWPFTGNANDLSGNSNNGNVYGPVLTTDRFGNANSAYSFDGSNDSISFGDIHVLDATNAFSVSVFFKYTTPPTFPNDWYTIVADGSYADLPGWGILINSTQFLMRELDGNNGILLSYNFIQNNWYHIGLTCGSDSIKVYINGNEVGATLNLQSQLTLNTSNSFRVGSGTMNNVPVNTWPYFHSGSIDDLRLYNRILNANEIVSLFNESICYQTITVTDTLLINTTLTGFNPVTYQNTIKIYPNPTNDHITIDNGNIANLTGYQIKITNSLSQQVFQSAITQQQFYVDLSTWTGNGIYFVHIIDGQGNTIDIKKIVLQ